MHKFDEWNTNARKEFKDSEHYSKDIGENFVVTQNGDVLLESQGFGAVIANVTPYETT